MTTKSKNALKSMAPVLLVLAIGLLGCSAASSEAPATVSAGAGGIEQAQPPAVGMNPSFATVKAGDEFVENITLKTQNPTRAAGCVVTWSGTGQIECVGKIQEGDFYKAVGKTLLMPAGYDAKGTNGQLGVASLADDAALIKMGGKQGTLFSFHFKALTPGEVNLKVSEVQVTDLKNREISMNAYDGKVVVQ